MDLPGDVPLDAAYRRYDGAANQSQNQITKSTDGTSLSAANGGRFGGGGRTLNGINGPPQRSDALDKTGVLSSQGGQGNGQIPVGQKASRGAPSGQAAPGAAGGGYVETQINTSFVPDYLLEQLLQAGGVASVGQNGVTVDRAVEEYLRKNNLIAINTHGAAVPVSDVLAELSRQSGTAIMLDPTVPRGSRFRITLSLPACSLTEALNLILPPARLRWRTINSAIFVTPTPEFQIFFGSAPVPYIIYGNNSTNSKPTQNGQQGAGQNGGQSGVQAPGQAPGQNGNPK